MSENENTHDEHKGFESSKPHKTPDSTLSEEPPTDADEPQVSEPI